MPVDVKAETLRHEPALSADQNDAARKAGITEAEVDAFEQQWWHGTPYGNISPFTYPRASIILALTAARAALTEKNMLNERGLAAAERQFRKGDGKGIRTRVAAAIEAYLAAAPASPSPAPPADGWRDTALAWAYQTPSGVDAVGAYDNWQWRTSLHKPDDAPPGTVRYVQPLLPTPPQPKEA